MCGTSNPFKSYNVRVNLLNYILYIEREREKRERRKRI